MKKPSRNAVADASAQVAEQSSAQQIQFSALETYAGALPPPDLLLKFDSVAPGTALKLIEWADREMDHRHKMEAGAQAANIASQQRQLAMAELHAAAQRDVASYQAKTVRISDLVGQAFGLIICMGAGFGASYLALNGHDWVAAALAGIPTAAIIRSFRAHQTDKT